MDCPRCVEYLSDYMDGTLGARRSAAVREHLADCNRCRREYTELQRVRTLLRKLPAPTPRPEFWRRAYATVRAHAGALQASEKRARQRQPAWHAPLSLRFAASVAPRAALFATTGAALVLLGFLTAPLLFPAVNHPAPLPTRVYNGQSAPRAASGHAEIKMTSAPASSDRTIGVYALVGLHAVQESSLPLADSGRMRYEVSEANQTDLEQDGKLDFR
ncbi:MAG TPA: zf-HC2 domain-containing protein [Chthonomonadaceae bacterium]|nr:zf-HC2 domain-containing protein [Chthonomonadaceae bacterium]